jgi:hypothetical protein
MAQQPQAPQIVKATIIERQLDGSYRAFFGNRNLATGEFQTITSTPAVIKNGQVFTNGPSGLKLITDPMEFETKTYNSGNPVYKLNPDGSVFIDPKTHQPVNTPIEASAQDFGVLQSPAPGAAIELIGPVTTPIGDNPAAPTPEQTAIQKAAEAAKNEPPLMKGPSIPSGNAIRDPLGNQIGTLSRGTDNQYHLYDTQGNEVGLYTNVGDAMDGAKNYGLTGGTWDMDDIPKDLQPKTKGKGGSSKDVNGKEGAQPKVSKQQAAMAIAGLGMLSYSIFSMIRNKQVNAGSLISLGFGAWQTLTNVQTVFKSFSKEGAMSFLAKHPTTVTVMIIAAVIVLSLLYNKLKPKKDVASTTGPLNTSQPGASTSSTPSTNPAPQPWYAGLPTQSVFYFAAGAATLAIGASLLNLDASSDKFANDYAYNVTAAQLPTVRNGIQAKLRSGETMPNNIVGTVAVKLGDQKTTADIAVFTTASGKGDGTYDVNKVSLNRGGYLVSKVAPNMNLLPFWMVEPQSGSVSANPAAFNAVSKEIALLQAANSVPSATSADNAVTKAAATDHGF